MTAERLFILCGMTGAGAGLGVLYFSGLWLTLRRIDIRGRRFWLRLAVSFLGRLLVVLAAFFWLMRDDWQRLLALVAGFLLARTVMVRRLGGRQAAGVGTGAR